VEDGDLASRTVSRGRTGDGSPGGGTKFWPRLPAPQRAFRFNPLEILPAAGARSHGRWRGADPHAQDLPRQGMAAQGMPLRAAGEWGIGCLTPF